MDKTRKQQEYDFKRNLIIDAAKIIFFDKGFESSTIDDIAKEAGYSKGSIYSYFKSKNEICFSLVNNYYYKIVNIMSKISLESGTAIEKLIKVKEFFLLTFSQNTDYCKILDSFKYHRRQCAEVVNELHINQAYNKEIKQTLIRIIKDGFEDNSIKNTIDPEKLANAFWNDEAGFISELRYSSKNSYDYLFDLIIESIKKK